MLPELSLGFHSNKNTTQKRKMKSNRKFIVRLHACQNISGNLHCSPLMSTHATTFSEPQSIYQTIAETKAFYLNDRQPFAVKRIQDSTFFTPARKKQTLRKFYQWKGIMSKQIRNYIQLHPDLMHVEFHKRKISMHNVLQSSTSFGADDYLFMS